MTDELTTFGATLRSWRDRLAPAAAGLPLRRGRRTQGLRREELAELAGLSVDYVVRLEQGRATAPSAQVVSALARALQLTSAERDHLYRLAGLAPPSDLEISDHVPRGVQRVLSRQGDSAIAVFAADWRLISWNTAWAALVGDPSTVPRDLRNFALDTFPVGDVGRALAQWPVVAFAEDTVDAAVVSDLRRASGRFPGSRRLNDLIRMLSEGNERFAALWTRGEVGAHREGQKIVEHPGVGPITVECDVLTDGEAELKIVILSTAPGTEDETRMKLAILSGVRERAAADR
ncbi:helix-turn-helix transcriptional regulator [Aeromicrobium chenweiae]|uniref:Transcriptional regulator n=1 Tax=Aeromicrobium chenweiae TaxID=2079793 RepID=A0A2S0WMZ2_9ACTN|nr:helix-turn-helix transcriptional regulator [Aeromicrobium chenweiae]AWB92676.1 transcriptional regulator [Aeromicrobium chenweiae]TGN33666.1 XRE family transcriptional regulator [Aeromicrobium chenweiae]